MDSKLKDKKFTSFLSQVLHPLITWLKANPVITWKDNTTLLFRSTRNANVSYVKTRYKHRASVSSPQDPAISTCLNIQNECVTLENFCVRLDIANVPSNPSTDSPKNYGANWDVGIFIGCRVKVTFKDVAVIGYHRKANIWIDVTQDSKMPRFSPPNGIRFPEGSVPHGADWCSMYGVMTYGGLWGLRVQGAEPAAGYDTYGPQYYDEVSKKLHADARGRFGFSDFLMIGCTIQGCDHHTGWRMKDISSSPNVINDIDAGGAYTISGLSGSGKLQGHRYIDCRFSTWSPFNIRLDRSNRDTFIGCHAETHGGPHFSSTGAAITKSAQTYYGDICKTANTTTTKLIASWITLYDNYFTFGQRDFRLAPDNNVQDIYGNTLVPSVTNTFSFGSGSRRWSQIYAASGQVSTSDLNMKTEITDIPEKVFEALSRIDFKQFKMIDAVKEKGDAARFHIGAIAQQVQEAFDSVGLNAEQYGLFCCDQLQDEQGGDDGEIQHKKELPQEPAEKIYGLRYDELLYLACAVSLWKLKILEERLNVLNPT